MAAHSGSDSESGSDCDFALPKGPSRRPASGGSLQPPLHGQNGGAKKTKKRKRASPSPSPSGSCSDEEDRGKSESDRESDEEEREVWTSGKHRRRRYSSKDPESAFAAVGTLLGGEDCDGSDKQFHCVLRCIAHWTNYLQTAAPAQCTFFHCVLQAIAMHSATVPSQHQNGRLE